MHGAYDLLIAQLATSPSVCERLAGRLRPPIETAAAKRSDNDLDATWFDQLVKQPASGIVLLPMAHFHYSAAEWLRQLKQVTRADRADPDLVDAVADSAVDDNPVGIGEVSPEEHLFVAEVPQGRHSCSSDVYIMVASGVARSREDDVEDAGEDGDVCRKSRSFGRIDGTPAILDEGWQAPSIDEDVTIRLRTAERWAPPCALHLGFEPRFSSAREDGVFGPTAHSCSGPLCAVYETAASRLATRAQSAPERLEGDGVAILNADQRKAYDLLKRKEPGRRDGSALRP